MSKLEPKDPLNPPLIFGQHLHEREILKLIGAVQTPEKVTGHTYNAKHSSEDGTCRFTYADSCNGTCQQSCYGTCAASTACSMCGTMQCYSGNEI